MIIIEDGVIVGVGLDAIEIDEHIFELLEQTTPGAGGEIQLTDGIKALLKEEKVFGYTFEGKRYDAGDKFGMLQATVEFALKRPEFGEKFREYLRTLPL